MIEVVSFPDPLASWNAQDRPFYLEFYGETSPVVDPTFAQVHPGGPKQLAESRGRHRLC